MARPIVSSAGRAAADRAAAITEGWAKPARKPEPAVQTTAKSEFVVHNGTTFVMSRLGRKP
jgi:hypothetical protein